MKKILNVFYVIVIMFSFLLVNGCSCKQTDDGTKNDEIVGYLNSIIKKIDDFGFGSFTYNKETISLNDDGTDGDKLIAKATFNHEYKAYLLKNNIENANSYEYLTYKDIFGFYMWGNEVDAENGIIIDSSYFDYVIKNVFYDDFHLLKEYKGLNYNEIKQKLDFNKNELTVSYTEDGKNIEKIDISIAFEQLEDNKFQMSYIMNVVVNESGDNNITVDDVKLNSKIIFTKTDILSSSYFYQEVVTVKNSFGEVLSKLFDGYKTNISISNQFDKLFYSSVNIPSEMPTEYLKSNLKVYLDEELIFDDDVDVTNDIYNYIYRLPFFGLYTDFSYLSEIGDIKYYEDNVIYIIKKSSVKERAKVVVVYLYEDENGVEHKKTTYVSIPEGRYELELEVDGVNYNDKILINGKVHNYESFGVLAGETYLVHCYVKK